MTEGLAYIGKIIELHAIDGADFIVSATVICGRGGKWRGVVKKGDFEIGSKCTVYLPDALLPPSDALKFMEKSGWRVKMQRYRGAPSEVLIAKYFESQKAGYDCTSELGVTKYQKPVPTNLQGKVLGDFPSFIPKTDELNYQRYPELVGQLLGHEYYVTEKMDGSSCTVYRYKGTFGVCSRNLELQRVEENGYWKVAGKYRLEELLPEGVALQFETCGPKIQGNPMGLSDIDGFAFSVYDIVNQRYFEHNAFLELCHSIEFPICKHERAQETFTGKDLDTLGEGKYANGNEREGVVVRSTKNLLGHKPISFKVINLGYEK